MDDSMNEDRNEVINSTNLYFQTEGRRPRLLLAAFMGQNIESLNYLSSSLADLGFDIDIASLNLTLPQMLLQSQENDVHGIVIQVSLNNLDAVLSHLREYFKKSHENEPQIFLRSESGNTMPKTKLSSNQICLISDDWSSVETAAYILDNFS